MLTKKQLTHIEHRLLEERARALRSLGLFDEMAKADRESGDSDLAAYTDHMADQGTEAMEREKAALFATKEGRYLYRIEEALRRLYNSPETFGTCHTCGAEVGFERLDALPAGSFVVVRALPAAATTSYSELGAQLDSGLRRVGERLAVAR